MKMRNFILKNTYGLLIFNLRKKTNFYVSVCIIRISMNRIKVINTQFMIKLNKNLIRQLLCFYSMFDSKIY